MKKPTVLYEVDPHNRLIIKKDATPSNVKRFRKVIQGRFRIDNKNRLYYEVYKSARIRVPQKIKFSGKYSLDKRHNLIFTLDKWSNQCQGNRLRLKTQIVNLDGEKIVFLLNTRRLGEKNYIYKITVHGSPHADKNNRLIFGIKKEKDKIDNLTFFNAWRINKNNEIVYNYARASQAITLKGYWDIKDRYRLRYVLDRKINSGFNFRSSLGQIVPKGKKTYIKFEIAIDISKKKRIKRNLIFRCKCKLNKDKKILLEVSPSRKGINLKLTKEILDKKGIMYIESFLKDKERYLGGGVGFRW